MLPNNCYRWSRPFVFAIWMMFLGASISAGALGGVQPKQSTSAGPATALAGEQIKWQVVSGGGNRGNSTNFTLSGTIGQSAAGRGITNNYKANSGFWQDFSSGESCCVGVTGNIDCDPAHGIDISDLSRLIDYLLISFSPLCCEAEANTDGEAGSGHDIADLTRLIDYLLISLEPLPACQ